MDLRSSCLLVAVGAVVLGGLSGRAEKNSLAPLYAIAGDKVFKEYDGNPILKPEIPKLDAASIGTPTVVRVNGVFHIYYEAWGEGDHDKSANVYYHSLQIAHATSPDGIHWTKDPHNPAIPKGTGKTDFDRSGTWDPFVIHEDGKFKMWYGGGVDMDGAERVDDPWGYAESPDGSNWTKKVHISPKDWTPNDEDDRIVHDKKAGKYYMYYLDRNPQHFGIFRVESPDETHFDFKKAIPIKMPGLPWGTFFKYPQTFQVGDTWYMFFGTSGSDGGNDATGIATSPDGVTWTVRNPRVLRGAHDSALLKVADDLYVVYYGPNKMQDLNKCDLRLAVFKGKLEDMLDPKCTATMKSMDAAPTKAIDYTHL